MMPNEDKNRNFLRGHSSQFNFFNVEANRKLTKMPEQEETSSLHQMTLDELKRQGRAGHINLFWGKLLGG